VRLVVVSPHLDDAVLCTGGGMGIARSLGIEVLIVTVFTANGTTERTEGLSDYARAFHRQCGLDDHDAVAARRTEDANAANVLDVDHRWLDLPDALYRTSRDGPLYKSEAMLFGPPHDPESLGVLARNLAHRAALP
jgi:LmbE family N-acetylglucosaminyl deacetylase